MQLVTSSAPDLSCITFLASTHPSKIKTQPQPDLVAVHKLINLSIHLAGAVRTQKQYTETAYTFSERGFSAPPAGVD